MHDARAVCIDALEASLCSTPLPRSASHGASLDASLDAFPGAAGAPVRWQQVFDALWSAGREGDALPAVEAFIAQVNGAGF